MNKIVPQRFPHALAATATVLSLSLSLLSLPASAASSHPLPLWRVTGAQGHSMYLAGSMHMLKPGDYPLPGAFEKAFEQSDRLVEEIDLNAIDMQKTKRAIEKLALLPKGKTLANVMGSDWDKAQKLADKAGIDLSRYRNNKPWYAALQISASSIRQAGYMPLLGLDYHFSNLAVQRKKAIIGLETFAQQLNFFNSLKPSVQQQYLLQILEQLPQNNAALTKLHAAWRVGNLEKLNAMATRDFAEYPGLRNELINQRNRRWLPTLERCLNEDQKCFVVVGAEHMAGKAGLVALLRQAGNQVEQLHGSVPASTNTNATAPQSAAAAGTSQ